MKIKHDILFAMKITSGGKMGGKQKERLRWRCRRGKLELDLFLIPFIDDCYEKLSDEEQQIFVKFLSEQDPDLHAYLMLERECAYAPFKILINKIRAHRLWLNQNT